jgi:hypothetical protein
LDAGFGAAAYSPALRVGGCPGRTQMATMFAAGGAPAGVPPALLEAPLAANAHRLQPAALAALLVCGHCSTALLVALRAEDAARDAM